MTNYASPFIVCFLWLVLTPLLPAIGQVIQPLSFNYTADDGLPSVECYEVIQDRHGYIWISTDNGIARYDGHEFEHFGEAQGLPDKTIFRLKEDHRGWIWMSSMKGNLFIYRGDSIAAFPHNHVFQEIRNEFDLIYNFAVDETGTVHASLGGLGLITINALGEVREAMDLDGQRRYRHGLYSVDDQTLRVIRINSELPSTPNLTVDVYQDWNPRKAYQIQIPAELIPNQIRISGKDYVGAFQFGSTYLIQFRNYMLFYDQEFNLINRRTFTSGTISSTAILDDGSVLLGLHEKRGLLWFEDFEHLQYGSPKDHLFRNETISHITQDKRGGIWLTSIENGLYYLPHPTYQSFSDPTGIGSYGPLLGQQDGLWVSTRGGRLFHVTDNNSINEVQKDDQLYELLELSYLSDIQSILALNPVALLRDNKWEKAAKRTGSSIRRHVVLVNGIVKKKDAGHPVFFSRHGLLLRATQLSPFLVRTFSDMSLSMKKKQILCGLQFTPNKYWFGTRTGLALVELDEENNSTLLDTLLTNMQINDLELLSDKSLLIGTKGNGLLRYDPQTGSVETSLEHLIVKQITTDENDAVWAIANDGLYKLSVQDSIHIEGIFSNLTGLPSNSISDLAFWENQCWISTPKQVISIPVDFHKYKSEYRVKIKSITLNGQKVSLRQLENIPYNHELNLQYTAQNYLADEQAIYRYRLSANNRWIETSNYDLNFVDLAPDQYQLEIQTLQNNNTWSPSTIIPLDVRPPFYRRAWFILLLFALGLLIIYYIFKQRLNNLQREKERLALQEEIGQLKQQAYRAQMNPHFIFNCLGTIQGMIIGEEADKDKAVRLIASFSQLIRYALEASRREQVALKEEINLLKRYLQLEQQRFSNRFDFNFSIDPAIDLDWQTIPPMLVQPYVENAVLHGMEHKEGDGKIIITYQQLDEQLRITIEDNGPGISYTKQLKAASKSKFRHRSAGMTITLKRLELLSSPYCNVRIFEPKDETGKILGTTVELTL